MKFPKLVALLEAACGVLVAATPFVLPVCTGLLQTTTGKNVPMRCYYTGQTEIAVGGLIVLAGMLAFAFGKRAETRGALNALVLALGAVVILLPTVILGTCASPDMACNIGTKPALILLGSATMLLGFVGVWEAWRSSQGPSAVAA